MEYEEEWATCHITGEETSLVCFKCKRPTNINKLHKTKIIETKDRFKIIYICTHCHEGIDESEEN